MKLSGGDSGAAGDLGLFIAARLLQDDFRVTGECSSLLSVLKGDADTRLVSLVVPVDPFRRYLEGFLQQALGISVLLRPDLIVATIVVSDSTVSSPADSAAGR